MVAFSLLMTIPVDCLVSATTWRRLYSKWIRRHEAMNETSQHTLDELYQREVTCCDLCYSGTAMSSFSHSNKSGGGLEGNLQDPLQDNEILIGGGGEINQDSSDEDIEVTQAIGANSTLSGGLGGGGSQSPDALLRKSDSHLKPRKRFRRIRKTHSTASRLDNSWSSRSGGNETTSNSKWSFFRTIFYPFMTTTEERGQDDGRGGADYDRVGTNEAEVEDPRLSALRESLHEYDEKLNNHNSNNNSNNNSTNNHSLSGNNKNNSRNSFTDRNSFQGLPNNLTNSTVNVTDGRASSLDQQMFGEILEEEVPFCPARNEAVPAFVLWLCCIGVCVAVQHWMYLAATFSIISIIFLMFIFPSSMYFRLGLLSDYQAIPLFGETIPNRFYMTIVRYLGIGLLVFDILLMACLILTGQNIIGRES
jgi:hypothetical protein